MCSDLGTASNFLKNYFNKVRPLPKVEEGRQHPLGKGRKTLGSVPRLHPGEGLGPSNLAPRSAGARVLRRVES